MALARPYSSTMDSTQNARQRTSPANDPSTILHPQQLQLHQQQHHQQQQLLQQQQQLLLQQQQHPAAPYTYPVQQQPQGSWTPNITAAPFVPSFYQNHQQQQQQQQLAQGSPQPYPPQTPYFDPANAQLAAQWAYQQMMFNAHHGFPQMSPQRPSATNPTQPGTPDYFAQNQQLFNPFPSGTPPPRQDHSSQQQQYPGYHPYRRPNRQQQQPASPSDDQQRRQGLGQVPHPPYARPDASGSSSSVNSSSSQRQRTNSNQSAHSSSGHHAPSSLRSASSSARSSPSPAGPSSSSTSSSSPTPSPLRQPHTRTGSATSSTSTSTATSTRPSGFSPPSSQPTIATSPASASTSASRLARPSPLSQDTFTVSEKRRSRDDSDIAALMHEQTPTATMIRSGGLKGRLRRALSFNAAQTLKEEADAAAIPEEDEEDDDVSIKASQVNGKLKAKAAPPAVKVDTKTPGGEDEPGPSTTPVKKKGRAASLFNSRLNASTDNISLSSTVSSASVMIRKLGAMGKLARRNSLAGITSLFKDKDKDKDKEGKDDKDKKGKKKEKKEKTAKGQASEASVSHVTAELDRMGAGGDWSVGADMNGLSPAAKLARQHTLKSNAEAAAKAKEAVVAAAAAEAAAKEAASAATSVNGVNGAAGVPTWDRNTATRHGSVSPVKGGGGMHRINEDGTRTLIESDDEESDDGHYQHHYQHPQQQQQQRQQGFHADGWDDDEEWDIDPENEPDGDEDVTIRVGIDNRGSEDSERTTSTSTTTSSTSASEMEPWAVDVRRSVEKTRRPTKGILKGAESYDQQSYLHDTHAHAQFRARSNSYTSGAPQTPSELGPLARMPSPDPDHIDGLHRHGSHSSAHNQPQVQEAPWLPPLSFDSGSSPLSSTFGSTSKELPETPSSTTLASATSTSSSVSSSMSSSGSSHSSFSSSHTTETHRSSAIYQQPSFNSSAPALTVSAFSAQAAHPPTLTHRSATAPAKRLTFATNLSVYDTFSASVYDRRSEPATWSRLTPALAQRIKEELNSYKMEEMEVHAASRIHTQFFV